MGDLSTRVNEIWPELPRVISELENPVTRCVVRMLPLVEIASRDDLVHVLEIFEEFCEKEWETGRRNPPMITDLRGWLSKNAR